MTGNKALDIEDKLPWLIVTGPKLIQYYSIQGTLNTKSVRIQIQTLLKSFYSLYNVISYHYLNCILPTKNNDS